MMIVLRGILGLGCLIGGVLASASLYTASSGDGAYSPDLLGMMGISAALSFGSFALCRRLLPYHSHALVLGSVGSYLLLLAALLIASNMRGELPQTVMWLPIIILVGIPYMAPLVALSGLACTLMCPRRREDF
jgi:hypothetical protein